MRYGLLNLVQSGDRGGCSGQKANVILLTSDQINMSHPGLRSVEDNVELMGPMVKWAHSVNLCQRDYHFGNDGWYLGDMWRSTKGSMM